MIFGYIKCQKIMRHVFLYVAASLLILCESACSKSNSSSSPTQTPKQANVTTFAGNGSGGFADGVGTSAQFNHPYGLVIDGSGNLYVSDEGNYRIRKITAAGMVTMLAGSSAGHIDGVGSAAQFYGPEGLTMDLSGNIIVGELENNSIRQVTLSGVVTTMAGGVEGYVDGIGTAAKFFYPTNLTEDKSGNLFVADTYNQRIRKITAAGVVTTFVGGGSTGPGNGALVDGSGATARFQGPAGMVFDGSGNLYVADEGNNVIRKITSAGVVTTYAGSGSTGYQDGPALTAEFAAPRGLAIDGTGNLFVAEYGGNRIREIATNGTVTTVAGSTASGSADGIGTAASFNSPSGLAFDASGNLYVVDNGNNLIRKITFK